MKKFLVFILVLSMVIGTSIMASAVKPGNSIEFKKIVSGEGNPKEEFTFNIGSGEKTQGSGSAPAFAKSQFTIEVNAKSNGNTANISLPNFTSVGRYEYPLSEEDGTTAGMTYDTSQYKLVFIVVNGEDGLEVRSSIMNDDDEKTANFEITNSYVAGDLTVEKELAGNFVDSNDEFKIEVTLEATDGDVLKIDGIDFNGGEVGTLSNNKVTVKYSITGAGNFTINNIPDGVEYTVVETNAEQFTPEYDVSYAGEEGTMTSEGATATITNTRNQDIETGISLDNLPYIMTMVLALGGLVLFVVRKRRLN